MFIITLLLIILIRDTRAHLECYYDGNEFCINQEDILSSDLLPGNFLLMDPKITQENNEFEKLNNFTIDGSIDKALGEMNFHRKRMNEYLCHGFMAEEIFREIKSIRVKRRPDEYATLVNSLPDFLGDSVQYENKNEMYKENEFDNVTVHDKLLSDEGSVKYKDWLQRTTTLDDVYRHYAPQKKIKNKISFRHPPHQTQTIHDHEIEEFDGEVTGYAMPAQIKPGKVEPYYGEDHMISSSTGHTYQQYGGHEHYPHPHEAIPIIHEEHYYDHPSHHEEEEYYHKPSYYKGKGHELSIKDFFEIALTALAFLAFGLFIIQLLMNITNPMATTTTTASALFTDIDNTRFKRNAYSSAKPIYYSGTEEFNVLSHRVLRSIEAAMVAEQDSGRCLRWSLCTDNSHSRTMSGPQRIWLPIWSLGMSWVSGRMLKKRAWPAMLESVKASILGLGGVDCSSIYPDCELARERIKRRRRRRK